MATAPTLSAFKTEVIGGDISGLIDNITDAQFVYLLNQALINKHEELNRDCPSVYSGSGTLTFSSDAYSIALPTDIDPDESKQVLLFTDSNRETETILASEGVWRRFGGTLRFDAQQKSGEIFYVEYTKEPNEYDVSTSLASQTLSEGVNRRAKHYLAYEVRKLYYDALQNNEPSSAGNKLRIDSNDIS